MVRLISGLLVLLLLVIGVYLGSRWMLADLEYNRVMATLDTWRDNGAVTSLAEWERMREETEQAIARYPDEPEYHRLLGLLYEWRGFAVTGEVVRFDDILATRRQAVGAYREAAHLRPAQPGGWAHLARMKTLAGERDEEFRMALRNAINQGRHDAGNIQEVAYITSLSWNSIESDGELKNLVQEILVEGLQIQGSARGVFSYLDNADLMSEFCPKLDMEVVNTEIRQACNM